MTDKDREILRYVATALETESIIDKRELAKLVRDVAKCPK